MTGAPPANAVGSWKLAPEVAKEAQGLVVSGFFDLPAACGLLLSAAGQGGAWLAALKQVAPVTAARGRSTPSVALAFTSLGLAQLGVGDETLAGFALPFVEGMLQKDRRRRLGDVDKDGNAFPVDWGTRPGPAADGQAALAANDPIHALLLVYHRSHKDLMDLVEGTITPALTGSHVKIVRRIALDLSATGAAGAADVREHFGFVDGISQPIPYGAGTDDGNGGTLAQDPLHGVRLGDILLGYPDAHGNVATGPFMAARTDKTKGDGGGFTPTTASAAQAVVAAAVAAVRHPADQTLRDLARNGSYLVVRELRQHVEAFWASMEEAAAGLDIPGFAGAPASGGPSLKAAWLAERVIGRTRDGHMLRPEGPLPPVPDGTPGGAPDNDFLYFLRDRHGHGCPLGSHIRRANPRDGLAYKEGVCEDLLRSANAHRILRRGRKYGPAIGAKDDTDGEGLLFMCLNGDISRQFEFVQQNWMLNPSFATLFDEVDPLVGPEGDMTLPATPLRRRIHVKTFVTLVGGDYFFLPSLPTLEMLAAL